MKAEVMRWSQLARMPVAGKVVLLDGGLVTLDKISKEISSLSSPGNIRRRRAGYKTPWGTFESAVVRSDFLVAVMLDSEVKDQEKES